MARRGAARPQVLNELARAVPVSGRTAKRRRTGAVATAMFALPAEWERETCAGTVAADFPGEIVVMLGAMLKAPVPNSV